MAPDSNELPFTGPRTRLTAGDRRGMILEAAMEIFAEQGFHGTSTRDLARRAGVSEGLVFRHFPTKEALIRAILDRVGFADRIETMEKTSEGMRPRRALLSIAEHFLTRLCDQPEVFRVVFFGLMETPHIAGEFYQRYLSRLLALETRLFERAFAEAGGGLPAANVNSGLVARSFHGSLLFYHLAGAIVRVEPLPKEPKALAEAIVNIYLPEAPA